ncbi:GNAT family N-acetyltransferase [Halobaculum litoreum]|uniref:GNAT family N-acetyltransferase n=1 Tax=Halobaculum litoreum TaxID=3031998 RepID=A0ABD5XP61_9EURY|nr:GNAT family N-acetyltransferase [Halobaculum sp. DT92]
MSDIAVRTATVDDAERLAAVYRSAYARNRELGFPAKAASATDATVTEWIRDDHVLVAVAEGTVVGGVRLDPVDDDAVKLSRLAVHESRKGEGIGAALVDAAERWSGRHGHGTVRLTTPEEHPFLPEFYRDRGFRKTGDYPLAYRDYDEIVMEKRL